MFYRYSKFLKTKTIFTIKIYQVARNRRFLAVKLLFQDSERICLFAFLLLPLLMSIIQISVYAFLDCVNVQK